MWEWWCGMSAVVCMVWLFRQGDVPGMARWEDGGGHRGGQHKGTLTRMQTYESISLSLEYMEILPDPEPTRGRGYPQNTVTSHQAGTTRILGATLGTWNTCQILFGNPPCFATHGDAVLGLSTSYPSHPKIHPTFYLPWTCFLPCISIFNVPPGRGCWKPNASNSQS